ncbi:MAG: diacylglycerol kinase family protein, partial [Knoellia sp.]
MSEQHRQRIGLVINPTAGKNTGARIGREAAALLTAAGHDIVDLSAMDGAHAMERARAAIVGRTVDCIVVAGGDGMVHFGVNLVAGTDIPLGIVGAGTGNDTARELGLPVRDAAKSVERITHGARRRIDAVRSVTPHGDVRWFVGVLAAGFDAVVNERANGWQWPKGQMRY